VKAGCAATRSAGTHARSAVSRAERPRHAAARPPRWRPRRPGARRSLRSPRWSRGRPQLHATVVRRGRWRHRRSTMCRPPAHAASGGSAAPRRARPASPSRQDARASRAPVPPRRAGVIALVPGWLPRTTLGPARRLSTCACRLLPSPAASQRLLSSIFLAAEQADSLLGPEQSALAGKSRRYTTFLQARRVKPGTVTLLTAPGSVRRSHSVPRIGHGLRLR